MSKTRPILFWISVLAANGLLGLSSAICLANDDSAETANSVALLVAAASAQSAGNVEDAGFLFYAAQARFQIDKKVYSPKETGGNSPDVLQASLSFAAGQSIVQSVSGDPDLYLAVVKKLSRWSPKFPKEYDPGWEYENALGKDAAARVVADIRKLLLTTLREKAALLANEEYRRLTSEVGQATSVEQRYWAAIEADRGVDAVADDLKAEFAAATSRKTAAATRMKEIEWELNPASRWHSTVNWKATDYFEHPQVIELCHAIERNDIEQMSRLIAAGADVNAKGKDGMTLLLWSFPDRKLERFQCLLEHGANPNVFFGSDFNVGNRPFHPYPAGGRLFDDRGCHAGQTVTHLACRSPVYEYMELVFTHGGDPNVVDTKTKETPLGVVLDRLMPNKKERVELLIDKGANPNKYCEYRGGYPVVLAAQSHAYDAALVLVRAKADPNRAKPRDDRTLVHWLLLHEEHLPFSNVKQNSDYDALIKWLKEHDAPFEKARADLNRKGRP